MLGSPCSHETRRSRRRAGVAHFPSGTAQDLSIVALWSMKLCRLRVLRIIDCYMRSKLRCIIDCQTRSKLNISATPAEHNLKVPEKV